MVLDQDDHGNSDKGDDINTAEKMPVDSVVRMHSGLTEGLEQHVIAAEQESQGDF